MTDTIEQRLVQGLSGVADAILTSTNAHRPDQQPPQRSGHRLLVTAALILAATGLGVGVLAVRDRSTIVVATASGSQAATDRTLGLEPDLYFLASDLMAPTIPMQGRVELYKRDDATELRRGDLALIDPPTTDGVPLLRRIVGLPGEIVVLEGPLVVVDGAPITEPYLGPDTTNAWPSPETITLDRDEYLLLADNRDSSDITAVPIQRISRWAPAETTALQSIPPAERPAELADYLRCLQTAGVDVEGLPTEAITIFDATVSRLDPQTIEDGAGCMRRHHRLSLE